MSSELDSELEVRKHFQIGVKQALIGQDEAFHLAGETEETDGHSDGGHRMSMSYIAPLGEAHDPDKITTH